MRKNELAKKKLKFLERLITLGGILGGFITIFYQQDLAVISTFSLFIISSLVSYSMILFDFYKSPIIDSILYSLVSVSFAGIFAVILSKGVVGSGIIGFLIVILYYILLTIFIGKILSFNLKSKKEKRKTLN